MKSKLPVSKAKTAYGLLSEIAALAIAEPKRMRMGLYISKRDPRGEDEKFWPACGTVGCVAGWTQVLLASPTTWAVSQDAADALGISQGQAEDLFYDEDLVNAFEQGTARHARDVAAHIRRFQKKYRTQLLAKKLGAK